MFLTGTSGFRSLPQSQLVKHTVGFHPLNWILIIWGSFSTALSQSKEWAKLLRKCLNWGLHGWPCPSVSGCANVPLLPLVENTNILIRTVVTQGLHTLLAFSNSWKLPNDLFKHMSLALGQWHHYKTPFHAECWVLKETKRVFLWFYSSWGVWFNKKVFII